MTPVEELRTAAHYLRNPLRSPGGEMCAVPDPLSEALIKLLDYTADTVELMGGTITNPITAAILATAQAINGTTTDTPERP